MLPLILDYDDTLVFWRDGPTGEWRPGAKAFLKWCKRQGYKLVVASARANFPQGEQEIRQMLDAAGHKDVGIARKPLGFAYVDNRGVEFAGTWADVRRKVKAFAKDGR